MYWKILSFSDAEIFKKVFLKGALLRGIAKAYA